MHGSEECIFEGSFSHSLLSPSMLMEQSLCPPLISFEGDRSCTGLAGARRSCAAMFASTCVAQVTFEELVEGARKDKEFQSRWEPNVTEETTAIKRPLVAGQGFPHRRRSRPCTLEKAA